MARKIAKRKGSQPAKPRPFNAERLVSAAIIRNDNCEGGFRSHAEIRRALGDENPYDSKPGDQEGFLTSKARFVSRRAAVSVGLASGQLPRMWEGCGRELLSSDIDW
jgi:hypothetical protein